MATFGRYELRDELGRGGMATVYRAFDPIMEREVALKVLPAQYAHDPTFVGRFLREAKIIARLDHRNIVPVYDVGQEKEQPFLVMRLLGGGSLQDRLADQRPVDLVSALFILEQVAAALDFAHTQGIIHRDLKPSNILFDKQGQVFVSDFGIAKLLAATTAYTGGGLIGTPDYMSPEQAQASRELDARSDVYSLGIIVYQMLTGWLPYEADTPIAMALAQVNQPVPSARAANPLITASEDAALRRALAKNPAERYGRASEFVVALREAHESRQAESEMRTTFEPGPIAPTPLPFGAGQPASGTVPALRRQPATDVVRRPRTGLVLAGLGGLAAVAVCFIVVLALALPRLAGGLNPPGSQAATESPASAEPTQPLVASTPPAASTPEAQPTAVPTSPPAAVAIGEGEGEIVILTWPGYIERGETDSNYDWVTQFESDTGCQVLVETADRPEDALTRLAEGGVDVMILSGDSSLQLIHDGSLQPINVDLLARWPTVDARLQDAPWHTVDMDGDGTPEHYGVPYQWGPMVLMYDTRPFFDQPPESWSILYENMTLLTNEANSGKILAYGRPIDIAHAALYLKAHEPALGITDPYELNREQFEAALALLTGQRPRLYDYWYDVFVMMDHFRNGEVVASSAWPYAVNNLKFEGFPVESLIPSEGTTGSADTSLLPANAPHPNCAYMWLDHSLDPKVQGDVAAWYGTVPAVPEACQGNELLGEDGCVVNGSDGFDQIAFWKTPLADCGDGRQDCVPYAEWIDRYREVTGLP